MAWVCDILRIRRCWDRATPVRANITAVTITAGDRAHGSGVQWHVPKRELLTGLESLLECGELRIAGKLREAARRVREFESMQVEARVNGRWKMGGAAAKGEQGARPAIGIASPCAER
jgi:hypothetical protein